PNRATQVDWSVLAEIESVLKPTLFVKIDQSEETVVRMQDVVIFSAMYEAFPNTQVLQDKVTQKLDNELETSSAIQMLQEEILQRMH
ncbi:2257_t:CDS:2, partial [Rhizophagus irregularis]